MSQGLRVVLAEDEPAVAAAIVEQLRALGHRVVGKAATGEEAVRLAAEQGVRVLGVSNYYDYGVYREFAEEARRRGVFPLFGMEVIATVGELAAKGVRVNDPDNPGRMYLCGKGISRFAKMSGRGEELLGRTRRNDRERMREMTRKMAELFRRAGVETGLDYEVIAEEVAKRAECSVEAVTLQERHVAQAFQEALFKKKQFTAKTQRTQRTAQPGVNSNSEETAGGTERTQESPEGTEELRKILTAVLGREPKSGVDDAAGVQGEIRGELMKAGRAAFVPERFLDEKEAYELVLEMGGIPCYPTLADGAGRRCEFEESAQGLVERLRERKIFMTELIPVRNRPEVLREYVRTMREAGLAVVAGTEHNTLEMRRMEPTCRDRVEIEEELKEIFREGACVVAAHQALKAKGETGFVDEKGRPNGKYGDAEERIRRFAEMGEGEMGRYLATGNANAK